MEKKCLQCSETYETNNKKQKYCSEICQYDSYRKLRVNRITTTCSFCGVEFETLPNKLKTGKSKYCSRTCKDNHQKFTYSGSNNPTYGKIYDEKYLKRKSDMMKTFWEDESYRKKVNEGRIRFFLENGYHVGANKSSIDKRKNTMYERYGIYHNWNGQFGTRKCDKTTIDKYGKSSTELLSEYSRYFGKKTDIEELFEHLLIDLEIPYQYRYRIYDKKKKDFWFREYDFLIVNTKILIEVDGDYWHGNVEKFEVLSEFQKEVIMKDKIKEDFAKKHGYTIVRFWGSDIKKDINELKNKIIEICQKK
jgi:hypothetical protein